MTLRNLVSRQRKGSRGGRCVGRVDVKEEEGEWRGQRWGGTSLMALHRGAEYCNYLALCEARPCILNELNIPPCFPPEDLIPFGICRATHQSLGEAAMHSFLEVNSSLRTRLPCPFSPACTILINRQSSRGTKTHGMVRIQMRLCQQDSTTSSLNLPPGVLTKGLR